MFLINLLRIHAVTVDKLQPLVIPPKLDPFVRSIAVAELDPSFSVRREVDVFDEASLELLTYAIPDDPNQARLETRPGNAVDFLGPGDMLEDLAVVRRRESDQLLLISVRRFDSFAGHLRSKLGSSEVLDVLPKVTLHEVDTPEG